jgi:gliding motility-associated-like protein
VLFSNQSENAEHCVWDFGNGVSSNEYSPEYQYTTSGIYDVSLYIRSLQNCTDTFRLPKAVVAESHVRVKMPNAFTPGSEGSNGGDYVPGDRYNRVFYPVVASGDVVEYELQVFNRWGNLLFSTKDLSKGWDGYYNGKQCAQDVYVWRILCKFNDGVEVVDSGDITLLR